ncbi:MAG: excinuclease ABC subunit B [Glaciecola sp.]|jgi:excinuclease ABC subunit B
MKFKLHSEYSPTGDQPQAIKSLVDGINSGEQFQTLLGVTGSGKTFTMANVIAELDRPALILSHNKTLAAQLYSEFKHFFPNNLVEYFVSYYDYYQPEAFIPSSNTYIEKDLSINEEIEKLRLSTTSALLSGRKDIIVVSSVSCIYGIGNPVEFSKNVISLKVGQLLSRNKFLHLLVSSLYSRNDLEPERGSFRVKGDVIEIFLAYTDHALRISYWGDEIEEIESFDPESRKVLHKLQDVQIYPANLFVTSPQTQHEAIWEIQQDLVKRLDYYKERGMELEATRLEERVLYDLEMMKELGYCSGIENYSRYFDKRKTGERPFCLIDYFPDDFIFFMDESHVTNSQIKAMYGGDRSRKVNLVEHGFRLPSAIDNRPLKYDEFESMINKWVFVSATPGDYELEKSEGVVIEQVIRPTGLLDPVIEVRPSLNQVDDLMNEINIRVKKDERVLITTLTKRMAEELTKYLSRYGIKCRYIHSDVDTIERIEILRDLRLGVFDVLIGVNLLREGLDLPEVSLVAILDADKEGFLRSERALVQTCGRAARNINGTVIMYADRMTKSMQKTIDKTLERRSIQQDYNLKHGKTPQSIVKSREDLTGTVVGARKKKDRNTGYELNDKIHMAADPVVAYMSKDQLEKLLDNTKRKMNKASRDQSFMEAARLRDEMSEIIQLMKDKN